jgi:Zn ribbon nucleic-acid-binding protein
MIKVECSHKNSVAEIDDNNIVHIDCQDCGHSVLMALDLFVLFRPDLVSMFYYYESKRQES